MQKDKKKYFIDYIKDLVLSGIGKKTSVNLLKKSAHINIYDSNNNSLGSLSNCVKIFVFSNLRLL